MKLRSERGAAVLFFLLLGGLACSEGEPEPRADPIIEAGGRSPSTGRRGQGGDEGGVDGDGTTEGEIVQFIDDSFSSTSPYSSRADLTFVSPSGTDEVSATYDGAEFSAEGEVLGDRWVLVEPDDAAFFPTLTWRNVESLEMQFEVVARSVLDSIFQNLSTATDLDPTRSHLLIRIEDENGNGVSGVKADAFASSVPVIAYKEDGLWPTYLDATSRDGLAFVPNLQAPVFPGQSVGVVLTGALDEEIDVRLARGTITVVKFVAP